MIVWLNLYLDEFFIVNLDFINILLRSLVNLFNFKLVNDDDFDDTLVVIEISLGIYGVFRGKKEELLQNN